MEIRKAFLSRILTNVEWTTKMYNESTRERCKEEHDIIKSQVISHELLFKY